MKRALLLSALLPGIVQTAPANGASCEARSSAKSPVVVELYTSEGCNSCPPADQWVSGLKDRDDVIALSFHVDYWDRLGWVDRFASPVYTQRQTEAEAGTGLTFIYTPQVLVDGRDWRRWSGTPLPGPHDGVLELHLQRAGDVVHARVTPLRGAPSRIAAYWVATEDNHVSDVRAGENAGATLHHDNVVRNYKRVPAWTANGPHELSFSSPARGEAGRERRVVLVVTDARSGVPIQALALACMG
jgi:hypothetical protein